MNKRNVKVFTKVNVIGFVLVVMAGWIDTISLMIFLDKRASSMTGRAAKLGFLIFNGEILAVGFVLLIIVSFVLGAYISTLITQKKGLTGGLFFTGFMLIITAIISLKSGMRLSFMTIPMAMGSLNAATSLTAIDRTTHLTGASTDIGINLAKGDWNKVIFWSLRWLGFVLGTLISLSVIQAYNSHMISRSFLLLVPATVIISTAIIQKLTIDIPLLNEGGKSLDRGWVTRCGEGEK